MPCHAQQNGNTRCGIPKEVSEEETEDYREDGAEEGESGARMEWAVDKVIVEAVDDESSKAELGIDFVQYGR